MEHNTYEEYVEATRYDYPHGEGGECTSDCGKRVDCPVMSKEEWEELSLLEIPQLKGTMEALDKLSIRK